MRRSVSWLVLSAGLFAPLFANAGDKLPDQTLQADAREDVTQALIAEASGDNAERSKRLTKAWLAVPDLPEANWHLARVLVAEKWQPLAEVVSQANRDPDQEQYRALREKAAGNAKALRDLARWCAKRDWHDRARLHFAQLLALPSAEATQKSEAVEQLKLVQVGGNWLTKEEVQFRQEEAKAIQDSLAKWRPKLKALQEIIDGTDFAKRDRAIAEFEKLDDPTMIPALESFLLDGGADFQEQVVKKLAGFQELDATEALVRYAVLPESRIVRGEAIAALKGRALHEFAPILIAALITPINSRFQIVRQPDGQVSYSHAFVQETSNVQHVTLVTQTALPVDVRLGIRTPFKSYASRRVLRAAAQTKQANDASNAAADTELQLNLANSIHRPFNNRVCEVLSATANVDHGRDVAQWKNWWNEFNDYYWPKESKCLYKHYCHAYTRPTPTSCFLAGTPVRTELGTLPIESIKAGDRVLAQDQDTGELSYKVVLTTTLRPPAKMLQIQAGGEDIYTTLGHPFWVSGQGWKMARQLKAGDLLHGLGGATPITEITPAGEHEAHNLVVDEDNTYFVGRAGLLVHDNEFRKPTRAVVPGLVRE